MWNVDHNHGLGAFIKMSLILIISKILVEYKNE